MTAMSTPLARLSLFLWTLSLVACDDDFAPYNLLSGLRVLALSAEPPTPRSEQPSRITALVSDNEANLDWSWCPAPSGADDGFVCGVTQAQLDQLLANAGDSVRLPPLALGSGPAVDFDFKIDATAARTICLSVATVTLPDNVAAPLCENDTFEVLIRLDATLGAARVTAVRNLALRLSDEAQVNETPAIENASVIIDGQLTEIATDGSTTLQRGETYDLRLAVAPTSSQRYVDLKEEPPDEDAREALTATWFIEGGETDKARTSFFDSENSLADLGSNSWTTPTTEEFSSDTTRLFFVLRDNRDGTSWIQRSVRLEATP